MLGAGQSTQTVPTYHIFGRKQFPLTRRATGGEENFRHRLCTARYKRDRHLLLFLPQPCKNGFAVFDKGSHQEP